MDDSKRVQVFELLQQKLRRGQISRRDFFELVMFIGAGVLLPSLATLEEAEAAIGARLRKTRRLGPGGAVYVDDVFSNYLYTGNGTSLSISNGINLSSYGGMVWGKDRVSLGGHNTLTDTARGLYYDLFSNLTSTQSNDSFGVTAFGTSGFSVGSSSNHNANATGYMSWTFRKAAKFFDVVTYTGNGSAPRAFGHNLGVRPGVVIIKRTDSTGNWWVFHRSAPNQGVAYPNIGGNMYLDTTDPADAGSNPFLSACDSSTFTLSTNQNGTMNINGATYIAYLFAHDTDTTNGMIQCGSFTTNGSGVASVTLGWEPQWSLVKNTGTENWGVYDVMRGWDLSSNDKYLIANSSNAEGSASVGNPTSTGMYWSGLPASTTFIYIVVRRPNKSVTSGAEVYQTVAGNLTSGSVNSTGFSPDLVITKESRSGTGNNFVHDRVRGSGTGTEQYPLPSTSSTGLEVASSGRTNFVCSGGFIYESAQTNSVSWCFRRAPGVFDIVGYAGVNGPTTIAHSLGVVPEMIIVKARSAAYGWPVYHASLPADDYLMLNTTAAKATDGTIWNAHTSSTFGIDTHGYVTTTGPNYIAYLFATKAGISKVGSYTGAAGDVAVDCGFSGSARFVLVKRTDSTGDWIVVDSARGSGCYLMFNVTTAETATNVISFTAGGFTAKSGTVTNSNGATYVFLAFA